MVSVSQNPTKDISDIISAVMIFNEIILEWIFGTNFCEIIFLSRDIIITQCVRNNYPPNCLIDVSPIGSIEGRNNQNAICQTTIKILFLSAYTLSISFATHAKI